MKRGEVWTVSGGGPYAGKPRPAVIVQEDRFDSTSSITLCVFTTAPTEAPLLRMLIEPTGLSKKTEGMWLPRVVDLVQHLKDNETGSFEINDRLLTDILNVGSESNKVTFLQNLEDPIPSLIYFQQRAGKVIS